MSTRDSDEEFVTIRVPKRTADLMNVSLEIGTSPTALKGQVALFSTVGALLALAGLWGLFRGFTEKAEDFDRLVDGGMGLGAVVLGFAFFFGARTYKKAFKAKGLI